VQLVKPGSPAALDGRIKAGDTVRVVNGVAVPDYNLIQQTLAPPPSPSGMWPYMLFKAFERNSFDEFKKAIEASGGQAATFATHENSSDKPPGLLDDHSFLQMIDGSGGMQRQAQLWYLSRGITSGMKPLDMVKALRTGVLNNQTGADMEKFIADYVAAQSSDRSKVTLGVFRPGGSLGAPLGVTTGNALDGAAAGGPGPPLPMLTPTKQTSEYESERLVMKVVDVVGSPPDIEKIPDLKAALAELETQIGLASVKEQVRLLIKLASVNYDRELECLNPHLIPLNRLFLGNPGTGKTTVAKIYGRILKGLGYLSDGSVEVKTPSDLIASAVGGTEEKTASTIEICKGKVLVIDEAYGLHEGMYGARAIDTLVSKVHNSPGEDIAVLLLGYEPEMLKMLREANPGLQRRFSPEAAFKFEDFTDAQLEELLHLAATAAGLRWSKRSVRKAALNLLVKERIKPNFGNAGSVNSLMGRVKSSVAGRGDARDIVLADLGLEEGSAGGTAETAALLAEVEKELAGLFKVEGLLKHFETLTARLGQLQKDGELDPSRPSDKVGNYIFVGNPGTGKTTFARILAKWLRAKGVLVGDGFAEQSALNLQGEYLGQTKKKVDDLMASAPGGMVFLDEAYNLGDGGSRRGPSLFAKEAVDQLTFCMTDDAYKGRSVVVLAGYEKEMDAMLGAANPGFRSRFKQRVAFPDWDEKDVVEYLRRRCAKRGVVLTDGARGVLHGRLSSVRARPGWANARDGEYTFDELSGARATRLAEAPKGAPEETTPTFTEADAIAAMDAFDRSRPPPKGSTPAPAASAAASGGGGAGSGDDAAPLLHLTSSEELAAAAARASPKLLVVDFFADWCGPCKRVAPEFARLASASTAAAVFAKVDVDAAAELAQAEGVSAMPTFLVYRRGADGRVERVLEAGADLKQVIALVMRHGAGMQAGGGGNGGNGDGGGGDGDDDDSDDDDDGPMLQEGGPPQREVEREQEKEEVRIEEIEPEAQDGGGDDGDDDLPSVAAALQEACVELGYDATNAKRKELIGKLAGCEGSRDFPPDILSLVVHKTKREEREVIDELREQVQAVVSSMGVAIFEAEQEQYKKDAPIREKGDGALPRRLRLAPRRHRLAVQRWLPLHLERRHPRRLRPSGLASIFTFFMGTGAVALGRIIEGVSCSSVYQAGY